jgi:hypothetical protein
VLLMVGGILAAWFRHPTDWQKTWPDDFPTLARALGAEPRPERWARSSSWWERAPAGRRVVGSVLTTVLALAFLAWGATNPTDYRGYPSHTFAVILGALVTLISLNKLCRALRDLRSS